MAAMTDLSKRVFTNSNQEVVPYDGSPIEWRVSVYSLIVQDQKILVVRHAQEKLWDVPGGGIDLGEDVAAAAEREALEEAGAHIQLGSIVDVNQDWFYHRNGHYYQALQLFYTATLIGELDTPSDPRVEAVEWVPLAELATHPLPTFVQDAISQLR